MSDSPVPAERRVGARLGLRSIIRRMVTLQTLFVVIAIAIVAVAFLLERSAASDERHAQSTLLDLESFEFQVLSGETGVRGFALAHRDVFLKPYRDAFPAIRSLEPRLLASVGANDRPTLSTAFDALEDWRTLFAEPTVGGGVVDQSVGKEKIDRIRALVARVRSDERASLNAASDRRRLVSLFVVAALALALAGAISAGLRMARTLREAVVRPMGDLAATAVRVREGDLAARATPQGAAELGDVARAFNEMAAEVEHVVVGLRDVDELKTSFLATVNHELRTPLTSITGYLQLLERGIAGDLTPDQLEYVRVAARNGERLTALIDDLLTLSRVDAGRFELELEPVDVARQLRQLRTDMELVAERNESTIEIETPGELVIDGDPRRLQQSFANLVSNALKFNRHGGTVRISAAARDGEAIIEVADEGPGIPPDEVDRIGERFFRASTTNNMPGTGLGMAITREIIEHHGGRLEIESEVGKGSAFRIRLPR